MQGRSPPQACDGSKGFALIIVLWTLVLIAFIVVHITASGRREIRIADNLVSGATTAAAADGAIFAAIFNLTNSETDQRWPVDGAAHQLTIGESTVSVRVEDEAGWINPNTASPVLLEALLRVTGSDSETARRLAIAIGEWVGSAAVTRSQDARLAEYRAAGLNYGPPSAPLETIDELGHVLGLTPAILAAIRPHLTLFGPPEPSSATLDPVVAAAIAEVVGSGQPEVPGNLTPPDVLTVRITALALGPSNARAICAAITRLGMMFPRGYELLAWGPDFN
jgi:general secretion pathway protein K